MVREKKLFLSVYVPLSKTHLHTKFQVSISKIQGARLGRNKTTLDYDGMQSNPPGTL